MGRNLTVSHHKKRSSKFYGATVLNKLKPIIGSSRMGNTGHWISQYPYINTSRLGGSPVKSAEYRLPCQSSRACVFVCPAVRAACGVGGPPRLGPGQLPLEPGRLRGRLARPAQTAARGRRLREPQQRGEQRAGRRREGEGDPGPAERRRVRPTGETGRTGRTPRYRLKHSVICESLIYNAAFLDKMLN